MIVMSLDSFVVALKAQGVPQEHLAFCCPMCQTVQSAFDLIAAGAGEQFEDVEKYLGFSCVGRWLDSGPPPGVPGRGCNWTLGGLLRLHKLEVETPDGKRHPRFEPCTPAEAQAHRDASIVSVPCPSRETVTA